jgi:fructokinase
VTVIGEALIDLVPAGGADQFVARSGGSPFNVAVGLARLGHRTALMARLAEDAFGQILRRQATSEGLDLAAAPTASQPTTLAVVSLDDDAQASYDFYFEGTADWQWTAAELERFPAESAIGHFGSLAAWTKPGSGHIQTAMSRLRAQGRALISYDPNVRPALLGQPASARPLIEQSVAAAHVVKASREDVEWLYPGQGLDEVSSRWLSLGAALVVITDGADGAQLRRGRDEGFRRPGRPVAVVDTVGAGDAFTAGLLGAILRRGLQQPDRLQHVSEAVLAEIVDEAILVSALACERPGADPPTLDRGARASLAGHVLRAADFEARG